MKHMVEIRLIDKSSAQDIALPNQPFSLFGRMIPSYTDGRWDYCVQRFDTQTEMCFPDEHYDFDEMAKNSVFIGAYDNNRCVGLAIMQQGFCKYMYLYDLKVNRDCRGMGIGQKLTERAKEVAVQAGYRGVYTIGQDNNLAACLFYLKNGFRIGGLDTEVYNGTKQEGKADIIFYWDLVE